MGLTQKPLKPSVLCVLCAWCGMRYAHATRTFLSELSVSPILACVA